jgi:hypothetical protein
MKRRVKNNFFFFSEGDAGEKKKSRTTAVMEGERGDLVSAAMSR